MFVLINNSQGYIDETKSITEVLLSKNYEVTPSVSPKGKSIVDQTCSM